MMTRKESLAELIAKVEAGKVYPFEVFNFFDTPCQDFALQQRAEDAKNAYNGSLNAAKALHEAVLPDWDWCITTDGVSVYAPQENDPIDGELNNLARAWLLAILHALHSMVPDDQTP